ncbi:MAG TPA: cytochrome c biogenesis protein ResB [Candidatus Eremiobacteraeota bacterium]|nr:MAG: Cytochrome c biogenesis protein CcsB [bacterium ADurb.Bin363]HPZ08736.1 cytochrome c biogenesis protein ResB [Candidatus Eremiobacteraeota bacterium]
MIKDNSKKTFLDSLWSFFTSIKVAVIFILLLAVIAILGTIIQQQMPMEFYQKIYSPLMYKIVITLGLNDLYNSFIFRLLLMFIGINITVCTIEHFNKRLMTGNFKICLPFDAYKSNKYINFSISLTFEKALEKVINYLKSKHFHVSYEKENNENIYVYGEKGRIKGWGSFLVHTGLLIIFLGALYGGLTGFKDMAFLMETGENKYFEKHNNFYVKLKEFRIEADENRRIKDFFSDLEIFEDNMKILEETIEVNDPLQYKGVVFYQSSWGMAGLQFLVTQPDGKEEVYHVPFDETDSINPGQSFFVLENRWIVKVGDFYPDIAFKGDSPENLSSLPLNPAVSLQISTDFMEKHMSGKEPEWKNLGWLYKDHPEAEYERYKFRFDKLIKYSVLQVKKDPGIPIVYFGCFLLVAGMPLAFYISRKIIRICLVKKSDEKTLIYMGFTGKEEEMDELKQMEKDLINL